jgi:hypothetical protein
MSMVSINTELNTTTVARAMVSPVIYSQLINTRKDQIFCIQLIPAKSVQIQSSENTEQAGLQYICIVDHNDQSISDNSDQH